MCDAGFWDFSHEHQGDESRERSNDGYATHQEHESESIELSPTQPQRGERGDGNAQDDEIRGDVCEGRDGDGIDAVHRGTELAVDIPIACDGMAPEGQEEHVKEESSSSECGRGIEDDPRLLALLAEQGIVEGEESGFAAPQADVDEVERDCRYEEQVRSEIVRNAVVELCFGPAGVLFTQSVLPRVDGDEDESSDPGEHNEGIREVGRYAMVHCAMRLETERETQDDGYQRNGHQCPVQGNEAGLSWLCQL